MSSLPASIERIWWRTAGKNWQHHCSLYKSMRIFSDAQGQLTLQSLVGSGQISNSSELTCMSPLPASMKRIRWKTAEERWQHRFYQYNPICCHGNRWSDLAEFRSYPSSNVCHHHLQVWKGSNEEQPRKSGNTYTVSLWRFFQMLKGS